MLGVEEFLSGSDMYSIHVLVTFNPEIPKSIMFPPPTQEPFRAQVLFSKLLVNQSIQFLGVEELLWKRHCARFCSSITQHVCHRDGRYMNLLIVPIKTGGPRWRWSALCSHCNRRQTRSGRAKINSIQT